MPEIIRSRLGDPESPTITGITDVRQLSSYNWINMAWPTIVVPGSPAMWAPPRGPTQVKRDSEWVYVHENAARHPSTPLEPLFLALYTTQPSFDIRSTDVVTDWNNLRKLLAFVKPGVAIAPFVIEIEIYRNTALFSRVEEPNRIQLQEFRGHGHEFVKAYTQTATESGGYNRIISYLFGGMRMIVRHEMDGYVGVATGGRNQAGGLSASMGSLTLVSQTGLVVRRGGQTVPLDRALEIKTRAAHRFIHFHECVPQLWICQTPKLVRAYHRDGTFQDPEVEDKTAGIQEWEAKHQAQLRRLAALIRQIIGIARHHDNKVIVRYNRKEGDKLIISPLGPRRLLPAYLYRIWDARPVRPNAAAMQAAQVG